MAWLLSCWLGGSEAISTENVTVSEAPAAIVPSGAPVAGSLPGEGNPLISRLFATSVLPVGMVSVKVPVAG
ncbi:hypothetical protein D3C73_1004720 [compost metagenome]